MKKSVKGLFALTAAVAAVSLTACTPKTADKAKEKLEKEDYKVVVVTQNTILDGTEVLLQIGNLEGAMTATKTVDGKVEVVSAYWFEKSSDAKDAMDKIKENMTSENKDSNITVKRSGKVIYSGTEQAMKDFN